MIPKLACILAAGRGVRLGPRGELIPKGFLRIGEQPIIEESVQKLKATGIEKLIVVTGHLSEQYVEWFSQHSEMVSLIHNPLYSGSGSLYSLWCARHELTEPYLLLESDLVYEKRALEECGQEKKGSMILVSGFTDAGDEVYVETAGEQLVAMSKNRDGLGDNIMGEFVGICKISVDTNRALMNFAQREFKHSLQLDYEVDGLVGCAGEADLTCSLIPDLVWTEIDTAEHLERCRKAIYPKIRQS